MKHFLCLSLLFFGCLALSQPVCAQAKFTVSGYIRDAKSGETLIGVTVFVRGTNTGTLTNEYGFYSLTLPGGDYDLGVSYVGFQTLVKQISLTANQKLDVELADEGVQLQEVVVDRKSVV